MSQPYHGPCAMLTPDEAERVAALIRQSDTTDATLRSAAAKCEAAATANPVWRQPCR